MADSSVVAKLKGTSVLVTVTTAKCSDDMTNKSFVPLTVDYRLKSSAFGRIPTNYLRRDFRRTATEILNARMIDRSLRPLIDASRAPQIQIHCELLSVDCNNFNSVALVINAAYIALANSSVPLICRAAATQVVRTKDGNVIMEPDRQECENSDLNLIVTATDDGHIVMLDGIANNIPDQLFMDAISSAVDRIQHICRETSGLIKNTFVQPISSAVLDTLLMQEMQIILQDYSLDKKKRDSKLASLIERQTADECREVVRNLIMQGSRRMDGRECNQLRPIHCEINMLQGNVHGSALFQRGQTQVLCTLTLDTLDLSCNREGSENTKSLLLHYEFPAYATGEIKKIMGPDRREIGHGNLAERAIIASFPSTYPFTVRLLCEVLESNGSSSMAAICAGSLALMDAGINIDKHVAGVAMGLVSNSAQSIILTDINGMEDYCGDMDLKIGGTESGISAIQVDVKSSRGVSYTTICDAILKSKDARTEIILHMNQCIKAPRTERKSCMPVVEDLIVPIVKRAKLFGVGGINIKKLEQKTGASLSQVDETTFRMFAPNEQLLKEAKEFISELLLDKPKITLEFGGVYTVRIVEIRNNGVMVQFHPSSDAVLLPLSQIDWKKVTHPDILGMKVGKEIKVKYFGIDPVSGSTRISRKVLYGLGSPVRSFLQDETGKKTE